MTTGQIPRCVRCRHVMKPNIVLFGELLPWKTMKLAQAHTRAADLMLVAGSSLEVAPAGDLPEMALENGARLIIINYLETHLDDQADVVIRADVAEVLPRLAAPFVTRLSLVEPRPAPTNVEAASKNLYRSDVRMGK